MSELYSMSNRMLHKLYVDAINMAKADETRKREEEAKAKKQGKAPPPHVPSYAADDMQELFEGGL